MSPCKDCLERSATCHSTCEKYIDYRKQKDDEMMRRRAQCELDNYFRNQQKERAKRRLRKR